MIHEPDRYTYPVTLVTRVLTGLAGTALAFAFLTGGALTAAVRMLRNHAR